MKTKPSTFPVFLNSARACQVGALAVGVATTAGGYYFGQSVGSTSPVSVALIAMTLLVATWVTARTISAWLGAWISMVLTTGAIGGQVVAQIGARFGAVEAVLFGVAITTVAILGGLHYLLSSVKATQSYQASRM